MRESGGIRKIRVDNVSYSSLLNIADTNKNIKRYLYGIFEPHFERGDNSDKEYLMHSWLCDGIPCQGFAYAYLNETMTVSLDTDRWRYCEIDIFKDETIEHITNVFNGRNEKAESFFASHRPVSLVRTKLSPVEKEIKLRDDHGKDKLLAFSKKLLRCEYVTGIVNSLPFESHSVGRFIRRCYPDGKVDITFPSSDMGIGVSVQTTGRNIRETEKIATILKEEYS